MLPEELNKIIEDVLRRKSELPYIELKKAAKDTPEKLYDTLSSFANRSGGGIIIFGIDEKNDFAITGVYDVQDLQVKVTGQSLQMEPVVRPVFTATIYEGKNIVSAEISECDTTDKPCFYKGTGRLRGSYIRVGDSDEPMTEYEVYSYEAYKKKIRDELRTVERAEKDDFDKGLMEDYFYKIRREKANLAKHEPDKVLALQGLVTEDKPTVAGLMLLGEYPQAFFPQMSITAMVVEGVEFGVASASGARFIDNKRIDGTIPQMLEEAITFVRRNMRVATVIGKDGKREDRPEYPIKAVRELILNALIHRDYSVHTEDSPVRIVLYQDRLEVENPGGLYGRLTIGDLGKVPADTRNPYIAGNLEILEGTENRFSGIPTIRAEMQAAGLPEPIFESRRGLFRAILYNHRIEERQPGIVAVPETVEEKILQFCREPRTREEVSAFLQVKTNSYIMARYIQPMLERGVLKLTIPEKPKSRYQKYYSV